MINGKQLVETIVDFPDKVALFISLCRQMKQTVCFRGYIVVK